WRKVVAKAAAVVTGDCPPDPSAGRDVAWYAVDSSGVTPMRVIGERVYAAYALRPKILRLLPRFRQPAPVVKVRRRSRGPSLLMRFSHKLMRFSHKLARACEIDYLAAPSVACRGG